MARTPYSGVAEVQQQGSSGSFDRTQANPQEFGSGVGQAEQGLAQSGERLGSVLAENAIRVEELNQTRNASIATSAYSKSLGEEYAKFDSLKGQAAHDYYPTFLKTIDAMREEAAGSLTSPYARDQYDQQTRFMANQYVRSGAVVAANGQKLSWINAGDAKIDQLASFGINMQNNAPAVVAAAQGIMETARNTAALKGIDPEMAARTAASGYYHRLFESMVANGNTSGAQSLYQTVKPFMNETAIAEVDRLMKPANDRMSGDAAAQAAYQRAVPTGGSSRGLRNNNPLNLEYREGQGATSSDGRFGIYPSVEDGIAAATKQLQRDQDVHGLSTVSQIISGVVNGVDTKHGWSPSSDPSNPSGSTRNYVDSVSKAMGVSPDTRLDLHDGSMVTKMVSAMANFENGHPVDPGAVQRGVLLASGANVTRSASIPTSNDARQPLTGDQILQAVNGVEDDPKLGPEAREWGRRRVEQRLSAYNQALHADAQNAINGIVTKILKDPYSLSMTDIATNRALTGPEKISLSNELVRLQSGKAQGDGEMFGEAVDRIQRPAGADGRLNSERDLVPLLGHGLTYSGFEKVQKFMKDRDSADGPAMKAAMDTWHAQILGGALGETRFATQGTRQRWTDFLAAVQPVIDQSKGKMSIGEIVGANGPVQKMIDSGHYVLSAEEMFRTMVPGGPTSAPGTAGPVVGHWYVPVGNFSGQFREVQPGTPGARRLTAPSFAPQNFENPQVPTAPH